MFGPVLGGDQEPAGGAVVAALDARNGIGDGAVQVCNVVAVKFFGVFQKHGTTSYISITKLQYVCNAYFQTITQYNNNTNCIAGGVAS